MSRSTVAKSKMLITRDAKQADKERMKGQLEKKVKQWWWVPHPRTGIYYPKGHEWVMDDVSDGAACLHQTYWLRSVDGVDRPSIEPSSSDGHDRPSPDP